MVIEAWCSGNTQPFEGYFLGSNPGASTKILMCGGSGIRYLEEESVIIA